MNKEVKEIKQQIKRRQRYLNPDYLSLKTEEISILLDYINQLETNRDELKKWLRVCLEEEEGKTISKTTIYELGIITTLRSVIAKIEELERGKE